MMQVKNNTSIFMGAEDGLFRVGGMKSGKDAGEAKSSFADGVGGMQDLIRQKRQQAQKKAMKIVGDTFACEQKLDDAQDEIRRRKAEFVDERNELAKRMQEVANTPEEEMTEEMLSEKKERLQEYQYQLDQLDAGIWASDSALRTSKIDRLKSSPMLDAKEAAEEILDAVEEEVLGMLIGEGKERIDEENEEREKQAEKLEEENEERKELLEKAREKKEEALKQLEELSTQSTAEAQAKIQEILDRMKLLTEDLKGAAVDTIL